jgi:hypothetical protein
MRSERSGFDVTPTRNCGQSMLCQHDDLGVGCQKKENVPKTLSRRVAESWFIWFFIVCLFDNRSLHRCDCLTERSLGA